MMNPTKVVNARRSAAPGLSLSARLCFLLAAASLIAGCTSIKDQRGYISDAALSRSIQPGIDNIRSVENTLGRPTFTSQFGEPVWYYVSSATERELLGGSDIVDNEVMRIYFDAAGNVAEVNTTGMELVSNIDPNGKTTPTLGKDRSFLEDLFGNIGSVGAGGLGGAAGLPGN
ncbi:outer membrane protein assembly factor BamE [Croceicoccus sp. F390]|uniref:Outer membrane protein assembly factor BamE n=1 Tax=Croceicoccus esteveae TaxID=3075597 RepID=A0ABU2ZEV3_9SPHN|nr:outer membrane protein assembly factor BamE [Croceicoccus sp. F390]MDT0575126.1 outer membrane protein assembly factor BamE [Croceicoccus sp. F390]